MIEWFEDLSLGMRFKSEERSNLGKCSVFLSTAPPEPLAISSFNLLTVHGRSDCHLPSARRRFRDENGRR
jgi:hypothetical protein